VCVDSPGPDEDGAIITDSVWLYRWHSSHTTLARAERAAWW
jgi:hypothetical protein